MSHNVSDLKVDQNPSTMQDAEREVNKLLGSYVMDYNC